MCTLGGYRSQCKSFYPQGNNWLCTVSSHRWPILCAVNTFCYKDRPPWHSLNRHSHICNTSFMTSPHYFTSWTQCPPRANQLPCQPAVLMAEHAEKTDEDGLAEWISFSGENHGLGIVPMFWSLYGTPVQWHLSYSICCISLAVEWTWCVVSIDQKMAWWSSLHYAGFYFHRWQFWGGHDFLVPGCQSGGLLMKKNNRIFPFCHPNIYFYILELHYAFPGLLFLVLYYYYNFFFKAFP